MSQLKLTKDNFYEQEDLLRVIIHFARQVQAHVELPTEYIGACYELWYPFFKYREHAEEGFETVVSTFLAHDNQTPFAQIVGIIVSDIDNFKKHRMME